MVLPSWCMTENSSATNTTLDQYYSGPYQRISSLRVARVNVPSNVKYVFVFHIFPVQFILRNTAVRFQQNIGQMHSKMKIVGVTFAYYYIQIQPEYGHEQADAGRDG